MFVAGFLNWFLDCCITDTHLFFIHLYYPSASGWIIFILGGGAGGLPVGSNVTLGLSSWLWALGSWLLAFGSWLLALDSWLLALGS
jgi:hypothetical protein